MARKNAINAGDLITTPPGIMESLFRDELWVEPDLEITSIVTAAVVINGLISSVDNYYGGASNNAILVNVTMNERYEITSYVGSTKTLNLIATPVGWAAGNKCYIKNINPNIDADNFDVAQAGVVETGTANSTIANSLADSTQNFTSTVLAGMVVHNTTDNTYTYVSSVTSNTQLALEDDIFVSGESYEIFGTRYGWIFGRSLTQQQTVQQLMSQLCYESHAIIHRSYKTWKYATLEDGKVDGTLSNPLSDEETGRPKVFVRLSPIENIYNDFTLNYAYDYASKTYKQKLIVNKNSSSHASLDSYKATCLASERDYKVSRAWEYNADWIYDETTAINFLANIINWLTYQRTLVEYWGDIANHIQFEKGDRVLINYDYMMPTGINNSMVFFIYGCKIYPKKKVVQLNLIY